MKISYAVPIAVLMIIIAAGIAIVATKPAQAETIKLGFIGPLSGDAAGFGETEKNTIAMAINEINDAGSINGRKLDVIYEDGKCNGKDASIAAQKLVSVDKVKIILGGACSGETLAIAPITEKDKVILFSVFSSNPAITDAGEYIFRTTPSDTETGRFSAEKMSQEYKKIAILSENTDYAQGVRNIFKENIARYGSSVIADEVFNQGDRDFRTQISRIANANPDALLVVPQSGTTQGLTIRQLRELGFTKQIYTILAATDAIDIAGNAMEGVLVVDVPQLPLAGISVVEKYRKLYGSDPISEWEAGSRYDSVYLIADALRKCGENTGCIKDFLYSLDWRDSPIGRYKFDKNGDVVGVEYALKIITNGKFEIVTNKQTETKGATKIGSILPLTGDTAEIGLRAQEAVNFALEEINAAGGVNGARMEVIFEDGRCNSKSAADAANKLVNLDKVQLIIGGLCSGETLAAAPIAEQNKVVMLSPCSSAPKVSDAGDYIFRDYPSDTFQGSFGAEYVYNKLGIKKVAILHTIGDWGNGIKDTFKKRFLELGGQIVAEESFEQDATDMKTQLTKIKAANPQLVYMPAYTQGAALILKQAKELGINAKFLDGDAGDDPNIIKLAGDAAEGFRATVAAPGSATFAQRFGQKFGHEPIVCTTYSYDAAKIAAEVLKKAGNDGTKIKNELYKVKNYAGETGSISFDRNGDRTTAEYIIKEVRNGKFGIISPDTQAAGAGKPTIKLGATLPLTGDLSGIGLSAQNAVKLAAEEINAQGGINGRRLEIIYEDDSCEGKKSVTTVPKLISIDKVPAIIGPLCSAAFLPAAPIAEQNKVILFSGSATNAKITEAGDYSFRNAPSDAFQAKVAAEFIFNTLGKKRVAVEFSNEEYSVGIKDTFVARFRELGGTITAIESNERGATDMRAQIAKIKDTNPEIIYNPVLPVDSGNFLKNARELGITTTIMGSEAGDDPQVITIAQNAANGFLYTVPNQPTSQQFKDSFRARFGAGPLIYSDNYYDIIYLLADAMKTCGEDSTCIKDELYKTKDYKGASGVITLDSNGDLAKAEYKVKTITNQKAVDYAG